MIRHVTIPPSTVILKEIACRIDRFRALLKKAQRSPTPKTIHDVRVSIRRLEAAADFYRTLSGDRRIHRAVPAVDPLMKPLGKLRDFHVQRQLIERYAARHVPLIERFFRKIQKRIAVHETVVLRAIRRFPARGLAAFAAAVGKDLSAGAGNLSVPFLLKLASSAQKPVEASRQRYCRGGSMKVFHRMRIALKRLRYTGEILAPVIPQITVRDVERIHGLQREMGAIHDMEVLAERLKKYLAKKDGGPAAQSQLRKIAARRDALLKRFNGKVGKCRFFDL